MNGNDSIRNRNEHACALHIRAGNAGTAVRVNTRPRAIPNKKKKTRAKTRAAMKKEMREMLQ